jgi:uncharacterized protein
MLREANNNDLPLIMSLLKQEPDLNLFFIADIEFYGIKTDFMTIWVDELVLTIVLKYHLNMLVYSQIAFDVQEILDLATSLHIRCLSCGEQAAKQIIPLLSNNTKVRHEVFAKLTNLIKPAFPLTEAHLAHSSDACAIITSQHQISEFADLMGNDIQLNITNAATRITEGFTKHYIIIQDDKVIANANTSATCSVAAMIGGVYTLPAYRGQGLATSVVYYLCQDLLAHHQTPVLFFENPKAASIYHALGFEDFGNWYMITFQ